MLFKLTFYLQNETKHTNTSRQDENALFCATSTNTTSIWNISASTYDAKSIASKPSKIPIKSNTTLKSKSDSLKSIHDSMSDLTAENNKLNDKFEVI